MKYLLSWLCLGTNRPIFHPAPERARGETVVLVHGLIHRGWVMLSLARFLAGEGYTVHVYDYPSMHGHIVDAGAAFRRYLENLTRQSAGPVHLVTHSMGGLITRAALGADGLLPPERRGRWAMLAVPHGGSPVASRVCRELPWLARLVAPYVFELCDEPYSVPELPRPSGWQIGAVTGTFDRKVPAASSAYGTGGTLAVASCHAFLMDNPEAREGILMFLETGNFPENRGKNCF